MDNLFGPRGHATVPASVLERENILLLVLREDERATRKNAATSNRLHGSRISCKIGIIVSSQPKSWFDLIS